LGNWEFEVPVSQLLFITKSQLESILLTFISMNLDLIQQVCEKLPGVTTDIKWGNDLVFSVAEKMFCVCSTDPPLRVSFKVPDDEFEEISVREGFQPAPYMARAKWVLVNQPLKLNKAEWKNFLEQSYQLVTAKLSKKTQNQIKAHALPGGRQGTRHKGTRGKPKGTTRSQGETNKPMVKGQGTGIKKKVNANETRSKRNVKAK